MSFYYYIFSIQLKFGEVRSSTRGPEAQVALDEATASTSSEERGDRLQDREGVSNIVSYSPCFA